MSSSSAPTPAVLRPVAALRTFFSPPAVTPTAGPVDWFAAQRSTAAWSDGAGRGDVQAAAAPRGIDAEAADRGIDLDADRSDLDDVRIEPADLRIDRPARGTTLEDRTPVAA